MMTHQVILLVRKYQKYLVVMKVMAKLRLKWLNQTSMPTACTLSWRRNKRMCYGRCGKHANSRGNSSMYQHSSIMTNVWIELKIQMKSDLRTAKHRLIWQSLYLSFASLSYAQTNVVPHFSLPTSAWLMVWIFLCVLWWTVRSTPHTCLYSFIHYF